MIVDEPFTVGAGIEAGLTPGVLRGRRWDASVYGVRIAPRDLTLEDRCRMFGTRMSRNNYFSHSTAAQLLSMPLPISLASRSVLEMSSISPARAPHARGIRGHKLDVSEQDLVETRGIRHTNAARTWFDLSQVLPLLDLVAAGDFIVHWRQPLATKRELTRMSERFLGRRGMRNARQALSLLNGRAESPPESALRVILELGGVRVPRINHSLVDTGTGRSTRPDFLFDRERVILEYQGDYHRSRGQWRKDLTRRSRLEADGWRVVELNWDDLRDPTELVARIRKFLQPR